MATPEQIQAIAASMNAHRPDWKIPSLVTFLSRNHAHRSYRALSIAATFVATDPTTTTPALLNNSGPWWTAAALALGETHTAIPAASQERCPIEGHEHELAGHCRVCAAEAKGADGWLEPTPPSPRTVADYHRGMAIARAALDEARRNPQTGADAVEVSPAAGIEPGPTRAPQRGPDEPYTDAAMRAAGDRSE